jgi:putative phosphoribosyl transferase
MHPDVLSFRDRADAGRQLVPRLMVYAAQNPVVLALPRGGVPVAFEIARALRAPLDLIFVRKIGAPGHAEFGLGAVVDGAHPQVVLNEDALDHVQVPPGYIEEETERQLQEIERRRQHYIAGRRPVDVEGRVAIVVDDGIGHRRHRAGGVEGLVQGSSRQTYPGRSGCAT